MPRHALLLLLLPAALVAAGTAAGESQRGVSATFRALAFDVPLMDAAYSLGEDQRVPLIISPNCLTAPQEYRGPAELTFSHLAPDAASEKPLASTTLADRASVIVLFVPDGKGGHAIRQLPDNPGQFPWGSLRIINLTGANVQVVSGPRQAVVANGGELTFRPPAAHGEYAMTEILTQREDGYARGYLMRTFQEDDLRSIYFLLPSDPREHAILLKGIEERRMPEKAKPLPRPAVVTLKPRDRETPVNGRARDARR